MLRPAAHPRVDDMLEETDQEQAKSRRPRLEALVGSPARLRTVARDMVTHFEARQAVFRARA